MPLRILFGLLVTVAFFLIATVANSDAQSPGPSAQPSASLNVVFKGGDGLTGATPIVVVVSGVDSPKLEAEHVMKGREAIHEWLRKNQAGWQVANESMGFDASGLFWVFTLKRSEGVSGAKDMYFRMFFEK